MLNGKTIIIHLTVGFIKKDIVEVSECFPKSRPLGWSVKVELDLFNYAAKSDLKNATGVYTC